MKAKQWDRDIEKGIVADELRHHMYNLWRLSDGIIGKKPPGGICPSFLLIVSTEETKK